MSSVNETKRIDHSVYTHLKENFPRFSPTSSFILLNYTRLLLFVKVYNRSFVTNMMSCRVDSVQVIGEENGRILTLTFNALPYPQSKQIQMNLAQETL